MRSAAKAVGKHVLRSLPTGPLLGPGLRRGSAKTQRGQTIDDRLPPARTQRYAETVFDRSAKLLRSFASLGGITAMQYGLRWPSLSQ